jgi:flagellar capping protein FliD
MKVLTRRPKPVGTADVPKLIESAETAPLATETANAMLIEASTSLVKEPKSEKTAEQPKVLSPPVVTRLPKPSSTITVTTRKRRMASTLDVVLESMKALVSASADASGGRSEDAREAVTASTATVLAEVESLKAVPIGLVEESAPEKSKSPGLEAPRHGDLEYIVRHTLGKQLSVDQIAEIQHYART